MNSFQVIFDQQALSIEPGQSLLDAALQQSLSIPNSCRSGVCQSCLVQVEQGEPPPESQHGLSDNQKKQNFALACQLKPCAPLTISTNASSARIPARVVAHQKLNDTVVRLRLESVADWYPGQFLTLWKNRKVGRPYSIASLPGDKQLEFHIKHHQQGELSTWVHDQLKEGDELEIGMPIGNCFYSPTMQSKPLLLIGIGTGLAPLYGIVRDALNQGHQQPIILYTAFKNRAQSYLFDDLRLLQENNQNVCVYSILRDEQQAGYDTGDIVDIIKQHHEKMQNWCVFLCGAPTPIRKLQRHCFLRGASMSDIYVDSFISPRPSSTT